jgi:hypothetical protein
MVWEVCSFSLVGERSNERLEVDRICTMNAISWYFSRICPVLAGSMTATASIRVQTKWWNGKLIYCDAFSMSGILDSSHIR